MHDLYLILGCKGLVVDDFIFCPSVENSILKITPSIPDYNQMMDYFDQCSMFDYPLDNLNAVRHLIFNLQNRHSSVMKPLWPIKKFELYQKFIIDHKGCGIYAKLHLPIK